jgi:VCBS repeat-containing protein
VVLSTLLALTALVGPAGAFPVGSFTRTGDMTQARNAFTATLLLDGRVLVAGSAGNTAELYDPAAGRFDATGLMSHARGALTATRLPDGRVLVAGGEFTVVGSAELYDPASETFSLTGSPATRRVLHAAAPLPGGRVLVVAGQAGVDLASAEVWNPTTELFSPTAGSLPVGRRALSATALLDGRVLVVGGANTTRQGFPITTFADAYLYDPASGLFTATGSLAAARHGHVAVRLRDGRVLVAGGFSFNTPLGTHPLGAEIYDPAAETFTPAGSLNVGRLHADAALLPDGKVLIAGGATAVGAFTTLNSAEVYDPATGTSQMVPGAMTAARYFGTATALADGRVLLAGGLSGSFLTDTADLYVHPNNAPVADPQAVTTAEDTAIVITLTGSDAEGSPLTFAIASTPAHGTLTGAGAVRTYAPATDFQGADSFTFTVSDGSATSAPATVSLTVTPVNDAPIAVNDAYGVDEDTTLTVAAPGVLGNDSDIDSPALTAVLVSGPSTGTLTLNGNGSFTYTPAADFHGTVSFTDKATDGSLDSNVATVTITVAPVNDAPSFTKGGDQAVLEDAGPRAVPGWATSISAGPPDEAGQTLTFLVTGNTNPGLFAAGPAVSPTGTLTYTPAPNANGAATITLIVRDSGGTASGGVDTSAPQSFIMTVRPVNDAPSFTKGPDQTVAEDAGPRAVPGWATSLSAGPPDETGQTLSFLVTSDDPGLFAVQPAIGPTGTLTFTPAANAHGTATVTVRLQDSGGSADGGLDTSPPQTFSITMTPVNDAPTATDQAVTTAEDTPVSITPAGSDVDGDGLTFTVVGGPTHGTLAGTPSGLVYTPAANYHGPDSFTFTASDGAATSAPATVTITVTPVNDPPTANDQTVSTPEDVAVIVTLTGSDVEGSPLGFTITVPPSHGTLGSLVVTGPITATVTYTPNPNYAGPDSFLFAVDDGAAASPQATIAITVSPVNDRPVANAQSVVTDEDRAVPIVLTGSDPEGDPLTFTLVEGPAYGTLTGTPPDLLYAPAPNFSGADSLRFTVSDGSLESAPAVVSITVRPVNDTPTATPFSDSTAEDTAKTLTLLGSDPEGDSLTFAVVDGPAYGTLGLVAGAQVTYTPAADFQSIDSFTFQVSDGTATSAPATVTITVTPVNDAPVAVADAYETDEDTPLTVGAPGVLGNDTDVDGNSLTAVLVTGPTHGTLVLHADGSFAYTPAANYHGPDNFRYRVSDGVTASAAVTVALTVRPVNDPPVANDQGVTTPESTSVSVTLTGSDVDGDALSFSIVTYPAHGTLTAGAPGTVVYTPAANYSGPDAFTFEARDGLAASAAATVAITVTPVNDGPTANAQAVRTPEDTSVPIVLTGADPDGDPLTFRVVTVPAHGTLAGVPPNVVYTPHADFNGTDSFEFDASDVSATSAPAIVTITVDPVNDAPVARADAGATADRTPIAIAVLANDSDPDGDPLAVSAAGPARWGTVTVDSPSLTYAPDVLGGLAAAIGRLGLDGGVARSLLAKLDAAGQAFARSEHGAGLSILGALLNELEALQRSRRLPAAVVDALIAQVREVMAGVLAGFLTDTFTYTVIDGHGGFATATVTVRVAL